MTTQYDWGLAGDDYSWHEYSILLSKCPNKCLVLGFGHKIPVLQRGIHNEK